MNKLVKWAHFVWNYSIIFAPFCRRSKLTAFIADKTDQPWQTQGWLDTGCERVNYKERTDEGAVLHTSMSTWYCMPWKQRSQFVKKKSYMMKDFLGHQKEQKTLVTTWLQIYWFPSSFCFFHLECFERAKQSLSLLAVVTFPWQMDTIHKHTCYSHTPHAQTHGSPSGAEFLILKYTAINQSAILVP